ncbi:hypothetical protein [Pseudobdellovibrio exovorus]|uniref:Uncharacterized protein n=1 Tax=Pseudobdellovibrio exovorus JSS TaxID=1184267 RepID=M4V4J7_9BACT|nr:hypothetical protein [Pseudobdellovibrio exovorus]AGH94257.1 hypothetical protein A11Q_37 [Pseudobdellovibrio exovorus JSS]
MKSINLMLALMLGMAFSFSAWAEEGATTVGDGGHVVICKTPEGWSAGRLLDLFEAEVLGKSVIFDLGSEELSIIDKVSLGLSRAQETLNLKSGEINSMLSVAERFLKFPYDPWKRAKTENGGAVYAIKAKDPLVSRQVYYELERRNCYVDTVVIHPDFSDRRSQQTKTYENICLANVIGLRQCFLTNTRHLRTMSSDEKACLVIHETLRFLPQSKSFKKDSDLRRMTYQICTGQI